MKIALVFFFLLAAVSAWSSVLDYVAYDNSTPAELIFSFPASEFPAVASPIIAGYGPFALTAKISGTFELIENPEDGLLFTIVGFNPAGCHVAETTDCTKFSFSFNGTDVFWQTGYPDSFKQLAVSNGAAIASFKLPPDAKFFRVFISAGPGYRGDVKVTDLHIFDSDGTDLLAASPSYTSLLTLVLALADLVLVFLILRYHFSAYRQADSAVEDANYLKKLEEVIKRGP